MFTCIFPTQKNKRFRPDQVCFRMSRHVRPTYMYMYVRTLSTMTSQRCWCNCERMHWFSLYLCARRKCNFIFQQSLRIFTAMPKILYACSIFLLIKTRNNHPFKKKKLRTCLFSSPEFRGWSNEQLRHPLHTQTVQSCARHVHMYIYVQSVAFIQSVRPYDEL